MSKFWGPTAVQAALWVDEFPKAPIIQIHKEDVPPTRVSSKLSQMGPN